MIRSKKYTMLAIGIAIDAGWIKLGGKDQSWWKKPWGPQPGRSTPFQDVCEEIAKGRDKRMLGDSWLLDPEFWRSLIKGSNLCEKIYNKWSRFDQRTKDLALLDEAHRVNSSLIFHIHHADKISVEGFFKNLLKDHE